MARDLGELNREDFARYKDDVKKEGKPFFPRAIFHDTVMSLVVVGVIVALAAIWYYDADGVKPGILGPLVHGAGRSRHDELRPATRTGTSTSSSTSSGSSSGRRRCSSPRSASRRSASSCSSGCRSTTAPRAPAAAPPRRDGRGGPHDPVDGSADVEGRDREGGARLRARRCSCRRGPSEQGFTGNEEATKGATLFAQSGCLNCHTYLGSGGGNLGAPDLSAIGASNDAAFFVQYLTNPAAFGNTVMGSYAYLGPGEPGRTRSVPRSVEGTAERQLSAVASERRAYAASAARPDVRLTRARLPRRDRCVRCSLRGTAAARARRRRLRDRAHAPPARGSRCSRPSCTRILRSPVRKCSSASSAAPQRR